MVWHWITNFSNTVYNSESHQSCCTAYLMLTSQHFLFTPYMVKLLLWLWYCVSYYNTISCGHTSDHMTTLINEVVIMHEVKVEGLTLVSSVYGCCLKEDNYHSMNIVIWWLAMNRNWISVACELFNLGWTHFWVSIWKWSKSFRILYRSLCCTDFIQISSWEWFKWAVRWVEKTDKTSVVQLCLLTITEIKVMRT